MSLIDDIERLGHGIEHGMNRGAAIRGLCASAPGLDFLSACALLDDWRNIRRRYDVLRGADLNLVHAILIIAGAAPSAD